MKQCATQVVAKGVGPRIATLALALAATGHHALAQEALPRSSVLDALKGATLQNVPQASARVVLTPVREAALRDTARALGAQAGLGEESRVIEEIVNRLSGSLDARYRFSEMMMGIGILPAVISEARNAVGVQTTVMKVANVIYRLDEPARLVAVPPTWRDWLLVGLNPGLRPAPPTDAAVLPRDENERLYWQQQLDEAYRAGVLQAQGIAEVNLARLERTYFGMRRFYELYARGQVTAPQVVTATSVIDREDPNTVLVGSTVFRIVSNTDFVEAFDRWKPLGK